MIAAHPQAVPNRIGPPALIALGVALASCGGDGRRGVDAGTLDAQAPPMCGPRAASGYIGPCRCDADCAAGLCLGEPVVGFAHGTCFAGCDPTAAGDCTAPATCIDLGGGDGVCAPTCATHDDCGPYRACDRGTCFAYCGVDADCESGHCDAYSHRCTDGTTSTGGTIGVACVRNEDCRSDACERGACIVQCRTSADCPEEALCDVVPGRMGRCRVGGCLAPASASHYAPCLCDADCPAGGVCVAEAVLGNPMGACVVLCDPAASPECAPGVSCARGSSGDGLCVPSCATQADCDAGRACFQGDCVPACFDDTVCRSGHCDPYSKHCTDGTPTTGAGIGATCTTRAQCRSNICSRAQCVSFCRADADCPEGRCVGATSASVGLCVL